MQVQAYLFFDGRCDEAIEFYTAKLGAKMLVLMRFRDNPEPNPAMMPPGGENKVMHAQITLGETTILMSDGRCTGHPNFDGFSLAISVENDAEAHKLFTALTDGGQIGMPLTKTFFSSSFGMVKDRFGVNWMVLVRS